MSLPATIDSIHHPATGTWQYIVADPNTLNAVIIDPVLDFDAATQTITTTNADRLVSSIKAKGYNIVRILETHAHADHLTASAYLQQVFGHTQSSKPPVCIGKRITQVQQTFGAKYGVPASELEHAFDHLLDDDEVFQIGDVQAKVVHLPGHTPDHVGYLIGGEFPKWQKNLQSIKPHPLTPPNRQHLLRRLGLQRRPRRSTLRLPRRQRQSSLSIHPQAAQPARQCQDLDWTRLPFGYPQGARAVHERRGAEGAQRLPAGRPD
jgi:hypothetical protein